MLTWLDPSSPPVRSAVMSGEWGKSPHTEHSPAAPPEGEIDTVAVALEVASDILTVMTAFAIHPAGQAVEQFTCHANARKLSPKFGPLRGVVRLAQSTTSPALTGWTIWQGSVWFGQGYPTVAAYYGLCCGPWRGDRIDLELTYQFGSTVTASARRAVLALAHQIWLASREDCGECGQCELPERTQSIVREGLSITLSDISDFLGSGRTGLPGVDSWAAGVNPRQALARPAVYDPSAPPGVIKSIRPARTEWPS